MKFKDGDESWNKKWNSNVGNLLTYISTNKIHKSIFQKEAHVQDNASSRVKVKDNTWALTAPEIQDVETLNTPGAPFGPTVSQFMWCSNIATNTNNLTCRDHKKIYSPSEIPKQQKWCRGEVSNVLHERGKVSELVRQRGFFDRL